VPADFASAAGRRGRGGIAFLVAAGIVFEIIAFACSSPQTAEINIRSRGDTLMKWVHLGELLGVAFVIAAAMVEPDQTKPILAGGAAAILSSEVFYRYAKRSGLAKPGPGTEQKYAPGSAGTRHAGPAWAG
jgi:hypothetical protein